MYQILPISTFLKKGRLLSLSHRFTLKENYRLFIFLNQMTTDIVIQAFKCTYIYQIPEENGASIVIWTHLS